MNAVKSKSMFLITIFIALAMYNVVAFRDSVRQKR